jgi:restriction system protein
LNIIDILQPLLDTLIWLLPLMLLTGLLVKLRKMPWLKGWFGERLVRVVAQYQLDRQVLATSTQ